MRTRLANDVCTSERVLSLYKQPESESVRIFWPLVERTIARLANRPPPSVPSPRGHRRFRRSLRGDPTAQSLTLTGPFTWICLPRPVDTDRATEQESRPLCFDRCLFLRLSLSFPLIHHEVTDKVKAVGLHFSTSSTTSYELSLSPSISVSISLPLRVLSSLARSPR